MTVGESLRLVKMVANSIVFLADTRFAQSSAPLGRFIVGIESVGGRSVSE